MVKETDDFFSKEYIERNICHEMKDKMIERLSNTHISYDDIIENIRDIVLHSNHLSTSIEKDTDYPKQLLDNLAISVKGLNDVIDINNEEYTINESEILKDKNYEISCKSFINYLGSKVRLIIIFLLILMVLRNVSQKIRVLMIIKIKIKIKIFIKKIIVLQD